MHCYICAALGALVGWGACYLSMRGDRERELAEIIADKVAAEDAARLKDLELQRFKGRI